MELLTKLLSRQVEFERKENGQPVENQFRNALKSTIEELMVDVKDIVCKNNRYKKNLIFILFSFWWYQDEKVTGDWVKDLVDINGGKFCFVTDDQKPKLKELIEEFKTGKYFNFTNYACRDIKKLPIFFKVLFDKDLKNFQVEETPCSGDGFKYEKKKPKDLSQNGDKSVLKEFNTFFDVYENKLPDAKSFYFIPAKGVKTNLLEQGQTKEESPGGLMLAFINEPDDNFEKKVIPQLATLVSLCLNRLALIDFLILKERNEIEIRKHSLKSAIAAIMSRNGSHNIGSHVINRVVESIDSLNIQDHKYLFRYLQQRMDFVAQISTDFSQWSTPHWFVKEIMKGFYEQKHLLNYIASSEKLKGFEIDNGNGCRAEKADVRCIIKNVDKYHCDKAGHHNCFESVTNCTQCKVSDQSKCQHRILFCNENKCTSKLSEDISVSVPGGLVGFHAFYTILENFIRNSAKHCYDGHPKQDRNMIVTIEIWNYEDDNEYYTVIIRDNYSFVSGNINKDIKDIDDEHSEENLSKQKIWIYTSPENTNITCTGESNNIVFRQINESEKAEKEIIESANDGIAFVVDNGKVFRDNSVYKRLCSRANVRFIEGVYWDDFYKRAGEKTNKYKFYDFLKTYYTPTHFKINKAIMEPLIDDDGSLKWSNWGIGEMKITAGYLKGCSIREIGGRGDTNLKNIIKAIAIPEKDSETNQIKAYRLGYEFRMRKPVDVHIIGYDCHKDIVKQAERESIFISSNYDAQTRGEMIVLYDDDRSDHKEELIQLLRQLSDNASDSDEVRKKKIKAEEVREKIKVEIERYHKYRLFIVTQDENIAKTINKNENENENENKNNFLRKRLVFVTQKEFEKRFPSEPKHNEFDNFKTWLRTTWIIHVKEKIRGIKDEISLICEPHSDRPDKFDTKDLDEKLLELAFKQALSSSSVQINDDKIGKALDFARQTLDPYATLQDNFPGGDNRSQIEKYNADLDFAWENMETVKQWLQHDFGISDKNYLPPTLPKGLRDKELDKREEKENNLPNLNGAIKLTCYEQEQNPQRTIRYVRHSKCPTRSNYLYCEDLTGSASHYPQLAHMPHKDKESQRVAFVSSLAENGLFRIGIADERVYETVIQKERGYHELTAAGIVFFNKIGNVNLGQSRDRNGTMEISVKEGEVKLTDKNCCDIIVIHQGILDKLSSTLLAEVGDGALYKTRIEKINKFISLLKEEIPFIVVTSGRGRPPDLPEGVKFLPFSLVEASVLSMPHSKFTLVKQLF